MVTSGAAVRAAVPHHVPAECVVDLDVYNLPAAETDAHRAWVAFQKSVKTDLVWTPRNGGHWIAVRGAEVHRMIGDSERLSNRVNTVPPGLAEGSDFIPIQLDPPHHTPYRSAVMRSFGAKLLLPLEQPIRERIVALIEEVRDRGACEFMSEIAEVLPIGVFLTLIGVPVEDRHYLRSLVLHFNRPDGTMTGAEVMAKINEYLLPVAEARLAQPGDDLFSRILAVPIEGRPWTPDEALRMCRNLLVGGLDTVVAMLGFTAHHLARHPELQARLRDQPALAPSAADEFIRRFPPVQLVREVTVDHDIGGIPLKAGDVMLLPTMLHNLDERSFDDPLAVDITRKPVRHSTMGAGPHRCVGAGLARIEVASFLREWTSGIGEFRLSEEATMEVGGVATITRLPLVWNTKGVAQ